MREDKFNKYIGLGNIDSEATKTLVYSLKENKLYVTHKTKDFPILSTGLFGALTTLSYVAIRNITVTGFIPVVLSWLLASVLGFLIALVLQSVKVNIEKFEAIDFEVKEFLLHKLDEVNKLWKLLFILFSLAVVFALYYLYSNSFALLIGSMLTIFVVSLVYFTGIYRRKKTIKIVLDLIG
ncbi:TPA: hypothetical protein ACGPA6_001526 [Streptococcus suis]